jgi:hypothetical protein
MRSAAKPLFTGAAHLAALWAFAFAQPLFNLLGKNPEFFVARHNTAGDIVVLSIALVLAPPLLALVLEAVARLIDRRLQWGLHLLFVGVLVAAIVLQLEKSVVTHPAKLMVLVAVGAGVLGAWLYNRTEFVPQALSVLSPAPLVFLALFLLLSDVSKLVLPQDKPKIAAAVHVGSKAPVVALFFDEFPVNALERPDGRIDARRYPHFAELAAHSTWYRDATTVADETVQAVPVLMTGEAPRSGALPNADDHPRSLFTLLGGDYRLNVIESVTSVCPRSLCRLGDRSDQSSWRRLRTLVSDLSLVSEHLLLPDAIRAHLPPVNQTFAGFRGGGLDRGAAGEEIGPSDRTALFHRFLAGIDDRERTLHFLHLELPHRPWQYLPDGRQYPLPPSGTGELQGSDGRRVPNAIAPQLSWQRHLLQVGYADRLVGELIARLKEVGIWDKALVVVTPDHGMAFVPSEPPRLATQRNFDQIAGVPTFIKAPGQRRGEVSDRALCTSDVLPAIAELLNTRVPWRTAPCDAAGGRVTIRSGTGSHDPLKTVSLPLATVQKAAARTRAQLADLFGSGEPAAIYNVGQIGGVIGLRANDRRAEPAPASFSPKDPGLFAAVDPRGRRVPALLRGNVSGQIEDGEPLAIAVNGRVAAVTRAFKPGTRIARVLAMIDPAALRRGRNAIELFAIEGAGTAVRLHSLGGVNLPG